MPFRVYDIFSGSLDRNPTWLESVQGLELAFRRMKKRAEHAPGSYFLWDSTTQTVLALVDTSSEKNTDLSNTKLIPQGQGEARHENIVDSALAIMRAEYASLQLLEPQPDNAGELILLAFRGFNPEAAHFWQRVPADSGSTCAAALRTRERVVVADVEECDFMKGTGDLITYRDTGIRAVQSTPLLSRSGQIVGMISTHWNHEHLPTEHELGAFDVLARQAANLIGHRSLESVLRRIQSGTLESPSY